jgi:hypothetical protein
VSLAASILGEDALRAVDGGFELDVHLNWYRSLPLSCVSRVELTVAGEAIPPAEITLEANGSASRLDELDERWDEEWFVLDPVTLRVARPLVRAGERVDVHLRLESRVPYIAVGPDRALEIVSERSAALVAR